MALARERVEFHGETIELPLPDGPGKPLKLMITPVQERIPIYLAAIGPKNTALAGEIADGWLPIFFHVENAPAVYAQSLQNAKPGFEVACPITVVVNDDTQAAIDWVKVSMAFYIGGMGAKDKNFHLDVVSRFGFADEAKRVQELFLAGDRDAAVKAVPDALCDGIALCGPLDRIRERLELWRSSPVTTLIVGGVDNPDHMRAIAEMV
jgi:alkanesulfonate monooxygenase SsuD/methylene tetrahydromethanopterin reductase-like flavin-dependent oxidoreductase (luciferase family)